MDELNFSQQLDESFKNITSFFEEIATLLKDCDRLMGENGYTTLIGNTTVYEISRSILYPNSWIPSYLCRAYILEEKLEESLFIGVKFISIFLRYESGGTEDVELEQNIPLIVAGLIIPSDQKKFKFEGWLTKYWFWSKEFNEDYKDDKWVNPIAKADGTVIEFYPKDPEEWNNIKQFQTFAYHLDEIKNTGVLSEKIINTLINMREI